MKEIRKEGEEKDRMLTDALKQVSELKLAVDDLGDQMKEKDEEVAVLKCSEERTEKECDDLRFQCTNLTTGEADALKQVSDLKMAHQPKKSVST